LWKFIIILFFSKTILLTPSAINIDKGEKYVINLNESISAITTGANIQIDVSNMIIKDTLKINLIETRRIVSDMFDKGSIQAVLISENDKIMLTYQGENFINEKNIRLVLSANKVPIGVDFSAIEITSDVKLEQIEVFWKNYKK
jgi:predicted transcriptional regulator